MFFRKFSNKDKKEAVPTAPAAAPQQQTNRGEESSYLYKILLIGDSEAHKSTFLQTYASGAPPGDSLIRTIGVDFIIKQLEMPNGCTLKLQIWDTAGQERFRTMTSSYFRGASGILMCYDPANSSTFEYLKSTMGVALRCLGDSKVAFRFVGISPRSYDERVVSREEVQAFADEFEGKVSNCYLNAVESINDVFDALVMDIGRIHNIDFGAH